VDFQQGYLFARPMPLEDFLQALAARPQLPKEVRPEIMRS